MFIQTMEHLQVLSLSDSHFSGRIPYHLGNLTKLLLLDFSFNSLLYVDDYNWISQLSSLQYLYMSDVHLGKAQNLLQALNTLPSLLEIELMNCTLNKLHTHQHVKATNLSRLEVLNLAENGLQAPFLDAFQNMTSLAEIDLSYNNLSSIPFWLRNCINLLNLYVNSNALYASLPSALQNLTSLISLDLSENNFDYVPSWYDLMQLDLNLTRNSLNGTIPQNIGHLKNLITLYLSDNILHGNIPRSFGQLSNLQNLDMSLNHLESLVSDITWPKQIVYLNLTNNHITGSLPQDIADRLPNVTHLLLGNNLISGSIPKSLCKIDSLYNLDLSGNLLSGEIPNCWSATQQNLSEINLASNKLSGVIPSSLGNLSTLAWLHLNNNSLHGGFPSSLRNLKHLLILDVGENHLFWTIPLWMGNIFSSLQILRLRQNKLHGTIPSQLCQLSALKILDLSDNNLMGSIPQCIGNFTGMISGKKSSSTQPSEGPRYVEWYEQEVRQVIKGVELDYTRNLKLVVNMDLSNNNLSGSIPEGITLLSALHNLNLSYNHLSGRIPERIGDMKSLESLDISHDQLSGRIPDNMSSLTSLSHLNLSYNNLSGPIPEGRQLSTLDNPFIYAGNPFLCGPPRPNKCFTDDEDDDDDEDEDEDEDGKKGKLEKLWFYFVVAFGYAVGFWTVVGSLLIKRSWRLAYFQYIDELTKRINVSWAIHLTSFKERFTGNSAAE
uniref:LRR receptor-like serine/threonine-protein kinase GSO2 n=1 Tax=Cajanus cajan TaxID=3821 RepID=A0A151U2N9_CAJCA|nr:LRR receptor-like serine/threonine-protein kinase GSO2 [Cajanus cajan]